MPGAVEAHVEGIAGAPEYLRGFLVGELVPDHQEQGFPVPLRKSAKRTGKLLGELGIHLDPTGRLWLGSHLREESLPAPGGPPLIGEDTPGDGDEPCT